MYVVISLCVVGFQDGSTYTQRRGHTTLTCTLDYYFVYYPLIEWYKSYLRAERATQQYGALHIVQKPSTV